MRIHVIQHEEKVPAGSSLEFFKQKKFSVSFTRIWLGEVFPDTEYFDALILCGGNMNVDQESTHPWLKIEKQLIKKSILENKKIIGLCLGAQLLAEALGASVYKHSLHEVGWHNVFLHETQNFKTPQAGQHIQAFEYHAYRFELPQGAERIAQNNNCLDQGFVYGKNIIAFQFHPESTLEWIQYVLRPISSYPTSGEAVMPKDTALKLMHQQPKLQTWYFNCLEEFFRN